MKYAIETENLTKKYKNFAAVNSLNLKIPNKTIFGMLGPNGAGKTTTIKMLTCLIQPSYGTATVGGYDIKNNPNEVRNLLGMVPQQVSLYKDLTVKENAELCADFYGVPDDEKDERINDLMELVDIKYAQNKLVKQLSGGQKQKASLVASLVHRPDILFLDEPTIGLDPTTKRILWDLIRELNDSGHTIILCSHDMHEVDKLCDFVGIINTGNLVAYDTPQGLKDTLIESQKEQYEKDVNDSLNSILTEKAEIEDLTKCDENEIFKEKIEDDLEILNFRKISFLLDKNSDEILLALQINPHVHKINIARNGRITLRIDNFDDEVVSNILKEVINHGGRIKSIFTEEPSLEDVFIKATEEVNENERA